MQIRNRLVAIFAIACAAGGIAGAQTAAPDYFNQSVSGAFVGEVMAGPNSGILNDALGFGIDYWFRPRRWLALEAGFEQIVRTESGRLAAVLSGHVGDGLVDSI